MTLVRDYLDLMRIVDERIDLPGVRSIHVAPFDPDPDKSSKFAALVLQDGTVGLTYTGLDDALQSLQDSALTDPLVGASPLEAARLYAGGKAWQRSIGMAAINAVSQHVFARGAYPVVGAHPTIEALRPAAGDHIGMVGYFPPLVEKVRATGATLTVIELDTRWLQSDAGFEVTLDAGRLQTCNKVLMTGTVLINQTFESLLAHCGQAESLLMVGPTLGCLPDPLFARGVTHVGGCRVVDTADFMQRWRTQDKWRESTRRYACRSSDYMGVNVLLSRIA